MSGFKRANRILHEVTGFRIFKLMLEQEIVLIPHHSVVRVIDDLPDEKRERARKALKKLSLTNKFLKAFSGPNQMTYDIDGLSVDVATNHQRQLARANKDFRREANQAANRWKRPLSNIDDDAS